MNDASFYTATMAKVYAEQGNFEKAAEIYRYLLKKEPARPELAAALAEVEPKLGRTGRSDWSDLAPLFQEWVELLLRYGNLQKLKRLRRRD